MLRTLPEDRKSKWKDSVNKVVHAHNHTVNDRTGFSPFFLLFSRSPRLPVGTCCLKPHLRRREKTTRSM